MVRIYCIFSSQVEELNGKVDRLQQQIRMAKDKESITAAEVKHLKADISRYLIIIYNMDYNRNKSINLYHFLSNIL